MRLCGIDAGSPSEPLILNEAIRELQIAQTTQEAGVGHLFQNRFQPSEVKTIGVNVKAGDEVKE